MRYATLEQMQEMELGVTGDIRKVNDAIFERLIGRDGELYGWCQHGYDANGELVQWDRVSEEDAVELGLIARQPTNFYEWEKQYR